MIREEYKGDGLTELYDDEYRRKPRIKKFAWAFLLFLCWEMIFGAIFMKPQTTKVVMYTAYWIQTIGLSFIWILANWPKKKDIHRK